jgi:hypothetical protein
MSTDPFRKLENLGSFLAKHLADITKMGSFSAIMYLTA